MAEELRFHIEREMEERARQGADPREARLAASAALGGVEGVKEAVRDASGVRPLQDLIADFRYALRSLRRDPIYAAAAVVVLGVGLGAGTTVFAVADSVLFAQLPYRKSDRLVRVGQLYQQNSTVWQLSTVDAQAILEQQRSFEAFGLVARSDAAISGAGTPVTISVGRVTSGFFRALEVDVAVGRGIAPADEPLDAPPVTVVSHSLAEQRLGGPRTAVGRSLTIDGMSHTVVGVLPPGTTSWAEASVRQPALQSTPQRRGLFWLRGIGRLREGYRSRPQPATWPSANGFSLWARACDVDRADHARAAGDSSGARRPVGVFGAAVALVLLVAIVNVTTPRCARSEREPELDACDARRGEVTRSAAAHRGPVLSVAAGLLGLGLAALGLRSLVRLAPNLPRIHEVALDLRTVGFAVVAVLLSGLLVSVSPVLAALRNSKAPSRHGDRRRAGTDQRTTALRSALVVTEFALALPLLLGASLLFRSFLQLQRVDPGFDPAGVLSVSLALPVARYPDYPELQRFWRQLELDSVETLGSSAACIATELPPDGNGNVNNFNLIDRPVAPAPPSTRALVLRHAGLLRRARDSGRGGVITEADSGEAPLVASEPVLAERYYPASRRSRQMVEVAVRPVRPQRSSASWET
jgi:predicted permease